MNTIQQKAKMLLTRLEVLNEDMRGYEHENWHCVNVKRYNDFIDVDELLKSNFKEKKDFFDDVISYFDEKHIENIYYSFLENAWEWLEESIEECEKPFYYIKENSWAKKKVLSLGSSGGWACFQVSHDFSELEELAETDELDEYSENTLKEAEEAIEEIERLKTFIAGYNKNLSWRNELIFRIEEYIEELENEKNELANSVERLKNDIQSQTKKEIARLDQFKGDEKLKNNILRNLKSIEKLTM